MRKQRGGLKLKNSSNRMFLYYYLKMVSNLQKQLETERVSRKKLESLIKKQTKITTNGNGTLNLTNDLPNISLINVEHESSI